MSVVLWVLFCVAAYYAGFVVTGAIEERYFCNRRSHDYCGHPWDSPLPLLWPVFALIAIPGVPIWLLLRNAGQMSHKLASLPTMAERRLDREKKRKDERNQLVSRVHKLEDELGYPRSEFDRAS